MILRRVIYFAGLLTLMACNAGQAQSGSFSMKFIRQVVGRCIAAQVRAKSPLWDPKTKHPTGGINTVVVDEIPGASFGFLEFRTVPVYPDAPSALCYFDRATGHILRFAYDTANGPRLVVLDKRNLSGNMSSEEESKAWEHRETYEFPLSAVVKN